MVLRFGWGIIREWLDGFIVGRRCLWIEKCGLLVKYLRGRFLGLEVLAHSCRPRGKGVV